VQNLKALEEFKDVTQRMHSSYCLANSGLVLLAEKMKSEEGYSDTKTHDLFDEESNVLSQIPYFHLMRGMQFDGPISQIIAHGILGSIYMAWSVRFRKKIAAELHVEEDSVKSDIMGDIRKIRNIINHRFTVPAAELAMLKEIDWLEPGLIVLSLGDMNRIQAKINTMVVRVDT